MRLFFFFSSETHPWARRNLPTQWPVCMSVSVFVCVFVYLLLACVRNVIFHRQTLFSVLNRAFFLFFSLLVGTIETISRQSPVYCFCFSLLVSLEPCAFSASVSSQWLALSLPPGPGRTLGGSVGNEASIICDLPHPLSRSVPTLRLSQA